MATGLYDQAYEHDACGVGMVADLHGRPDHAIVDRSLTVLERLAHRGASGAEVDTGDGAGILTQVPHRFLSAAALDAGFSLPDAGGYAVGLAFLPTDEDDALKARTVVEQTAVQEGLTVLGWRTVPIEAGGLGHTARGAMPPIEQLFVAPSGPGVDPMALERRAFVLRKRRSTPSRASTSRRCRPARSSTRGCSPPSSCASSSRTCVTPLSSPASPSCTRASRPTPSPAGRWPTRTATCVTTGRSTRWPATATGCGPARHCSRRHSLRATSRACTRSARRGRATRRASTRCSSCCTSEAARCRTPC